VDGHKPQSSRLRRAFVAACTFLGAGIGSVGIEQLPKDPVTDTQKISTFREGTSEQFGFNISPVDQLWKASLSLRSEGDLFKDFYAAARQGDSWRIRAMIDHAPMSGLADPVVYKGLLQESLVAAAMGGYSDVMALLLDQGADPNASRGEAILASIHKGGFDAVKLLVEHNGDPNIANGAPLWAAALVNDDKIGQLLIERGADPMAHGAAPIRYAAERENDGFFILLVVQAGGPDVQDGLALRNAAQFGQDKAVWYLLSVGADPNIAGGQPLYNAVKSGNVKSVEKLLRYGANPNLTPGTSLLTLARAEQAGNPQIEKMLKDAGAREPASEFSYSFSLTPFLTPSMASPIQGMSGAPSFAIDGSLYSLPSLTSPPVARFGGSGSPTPVFKGPPAP